MTTVVKTLSQSNRVAQAVVLLVGVLVVVAAGSFMLSTDGATPEPVPFDQTTDTGIAAEDRQAFLADGLSIPEAQVFYSQYRFVVGYTGVEHAVTALQQDGHEQQFGYPIAVYVSDFSATDVTLTDDGYLNTTTEPTWVDATDAVFVIDSETRTPTGETAVPFERESDAESFIEAYGGEIVDWRTLQHHSFDIDDATLVRDRVSEQHAVADQQVETARERSVRTPELVVGEDGDSIQATLDAAPANATVRVPSGTYEETLTINRSVTLLGEHATIRGDGNGSVIESTGENVAIRGFSITGVGDSLDASDAGTDDTVDEPIDDADEPIDESDVPDPEEGEDDWDAIVALAYGYADAGILARGGTELYVADVSIDTPASGILLRDMNNTVVKNVTIEGTENWLDGMMGLMSVRSPVVVQDSTFIGGRDGIYLHRAPESVVRDSTFLDNRFGTHYMYTSDSLTANNTLRGQSSGAVTIMTDSTRNAVVGNDMRDAATGITPSGSRSYIAENVVVNTRTAIATAASNSLYERNVVYGNEVGFSASSLQPTSRVTSNDIVNNDQQAATTTGPLYLWSHDGVGNYWGETTVTQDKYTPTDPIQGNQHRVGGASVLANSPAATLLDSFRDTTPGMREATIMDTAPRSEPVQPDLLAAIRGETDD